MEGLRRINCVITDLDDTIWDWMKMWHTSFSTYLERIVKDTGVDRDKLISDFKKLHQKYGTSEISFVYDELETLDEAQKKSFSTEKNGKKSILHEYYHTKKNSLALYPTVFDSLKRLKEAGVLVIGFTESNSFFTKYRLKHLKLDGLFDCIYTPISSGVPDSVYKHYNEGFWEPELTEIRYLPKQTKKPNKEILEIILQDFKVDKKYAIYIGDKLEKDILMAQQAELISVHAKYGHNITSAEYDLLKQVTHWTEEDVQREANFKIEHLKASPDLVIEKYGDLFKAFDFVSFPQFKKIDVPDIISVWMKVIDVQQHFNDIALRIRNFTLTVLTFFITGIGYALKENVVIYTGSHYNLSIASMLAFLCALILWMLYFMDKHWYHKLLIGAVTQGMKIENRWSKILPEIQLSNAIKDASPVKYRRPGFSIKKVKEYNWRKFNFRTFGNLWVKEIELHSNKKFNVFYYPLILLMIAIGIILFLWG